jgi:hypothetical protein
MELINRLYPILNLVYLNVDKKIFFGKTILILLKRREENEDT